nr:peroxiredoxin family protein [Roseibacillus sp.]
KTAQARRTFPFPVLADPGLEAFRNYHVFDDFEEGPMHGTFLIGPKGRILWSDIGHEPFNHPGRLLEEARRLLADHSSDP